MSESLGSKANASIEDGLETAKAVLLAAVESDDITIAQRIAAANGFLRWSALEKIAKAIEENARKPPPYA